MRVNQENYYSFMKLYCELLKEICVSLGFFPGFARITLFF